MNSVETKDIASSERLRDRIRILRARLDSLAARLENEIGPQVGTYFPGEIRSRLRMMHGMEREISDVFRPGDDARQIDVRHLPATLTAYSVETAIALQQLRRERYTHYSDTELILVLDLSLSMITGAGGLNAGKLSAAPTVSDVRTGSLSDDDPPQTAEPGDKLWGLYLATNLFLTLGEQAGFVLRAICGNDGQAEPERALHPRGFRFDTLRRMTGTLMDAYKRAELAPANQERSALTSAFEAALEVRARSIVVVVSDFLDPVQEYKPLLLEILARHHVVLIDVANWWEMKFPMPAAIWQGKQWLADRDQIDGNWRDAARRVEEGTQPRPLRADQIEQWNKKVKEWRRELRSIASRFGAGYSGNFREFTIKQALPFASDQLGLVGR